MITYQDIKSGAVPLAAGVETRGVTRPEFVTITTIARSKVYFAQDSAGRVKIGYARRPYERLRGLQTANSGHIGFIRLLDGGPATERWLHKRFASARIQGEWFSFNPEMLTVIPPDEVPATRQFRQDPIPALGYQKRFKDAADLKLDKPGSEETLLTYILMTLSDRERRELLEWMRAQP